MKRLTVFIPEHHRLRHWSRSEWDLELCCTKCRQPCQPHEPWWWAAYSGEGKLHTLQVSWVFPQCIISQGWIFPSDSSIHSGKKPLSSHGRRLLFNYFFLCFSLMLVAGRGGDHAYWPPDSNQIDRSSINGESQRWFLPLGCVSRTPQ